MKAVRHVPLAVGFALLSLGLGGAAIAGGLAPPAGPVASSMRTLQQIEPRTPVGSTTTPGDAGAIYVISHPGSYYLTGDVIGIAGKSGIRIDASDVALDLSGFAVRGVPGSFSGIDANSSLTSISLSNGVVCEWGSTGVNLSWVNSSRLSNVIADRNGGAGISLWIGSVVQGCRSTNNTSSGFYCTGGLITFENCTAIENGAIGFCVPTTATLINCATCYNGAGGFSVAWGSLLSCNAAQDIGPGFVLGGPNRAVTATNCIATECNRGFEVTGHAVLTGCASSGNVEDGFHLLAVGVLQSCSAMGNADDGFELAENSSAIACSSSGNRYGFYVPSSEAHVRIESSSALANDHFGFLIGGSGCLIIRNLAGNNGSGNYSIATDGQCGAIISATGTIAADPWANFATTTTTALAHAEDPNAARKEAQATEEHMAFRARPVEGAATPTGTLPPDAPTMPTR